MRVLICGSRDWRNEQLIADVINPLPHGCTIIEGGAIGADNIARRLAFRRGFKVEEYAADWRMYGKAAGHIRNTEMLRMGKPDIVYAFRTTPDSRGTNNMIEQATKAWIKVVIREGECS